VNTEEGALTNPVRLRFIPYNARLIDARKAQRWTQKDLATLTGINTSYLGHIETLRVIPSQQMRDEICSALGLSEEYLFPSSLMEALREGLFGHRVAELEEEQIIRLTEGQRAGLLPPGIAEDEALEAMDRAADNELLKGQITDVLETLTPREKKVLELRFGLNDGCPRTMDEVGKEFNVTGDRIRQIQAKALRKLRHPSRSRRLKDYLA